MRSRGLAFLISFSIALGAIGLAQQSYPPQTAGGGGGGAPSYPLAAPAADNCTTPPYSFTSDATTGVCSPVTSQIAVRLSGTNRVTFSSSLVTSTTRFRGPGGTDDNVTYGSTASSPAGQAGMYFPDTTSVRVKSYSIASTQPYFEATASGGEIARLVSSTSKIELNGSTSQASVTIGGTLISRWSATGFDLADAGSKPTCNSTTRGTFWFDEGGAGVADTIEVCSKDAADVYAWRSLI
jgi:hypothetical protein